MVVLDLLELGSPTPALASAASSGASAGFCRGDVVLAKYGKTNSFYWAKVKKLYKNSTGAELGDVQWLRPQAGAPVGKLYALHDGHDETQHGDGIALSVHARRPCAADLASGAPAGAASAPANAAIAQSVRQANVSDLLGDPIIEAPMQPEASSKGDLFATWDMQSAFQQSSPPSNMFGSQQPPVHQSPVGHGWQNIGPSMNSMPSTMWSVPQMQPKMQSAATATSMTPKATMQQSNAKPCAPAASINDLQTVFVSDLLFKSPPGGSGQCVRTEVAKSGKDDGFDFISDMMSGALMNVNGS